MPAGKAWGDVLPAVLPHGLTALHGSSATVGVIGYRLGGGLSFYGRRCGLAANSVRSFTVVLALDGAVTATTENDLPAAERIAAEMLAPLTALAEPVSSTWAPASPATVPAIHRILRDRTRSGPATRWSPASTTPAGPRL